MKTDELDYELPPDRIATQPATPRDAAKLMVVHRASHRVEHLIVRNLPEILRTHSPGATIVFNETRVLKARFSAVRVATGGRVHGLYLGPAAQGTTGNTAAPISRGDVSRYWRVMLEARGSLREAERLALGDETSLELTTNVGRGEWIAMLHGGADTHAVLDAYGAIPLPPYILKARKAHAQAEVTRDDEQRYNTVYAHDAGSAAAPTAGLHFTSELLRQLDERGFRRASLTLHVGLGTFAPIRSDRVENHDIHSEPIRVPAHTLELLAQTRRDARPILAVGTTTVRALESLPDQWEPARAIALDTKLLIAPGFTFRFTDALMTNFHLPRSSLLALVAALPGVGIDELKRLYRTAIEKGYRFYSYGDAMLLI